MSCSCAADSFSVLPPPLSVRLKVFFGGLDSSAGCFYWNAGTANLFHVSLMQVPCEFSMEFSSRKGSLKRCLRCPPALKPPFDFLRRKMLGETRGTYPYTSQGPNPIYLGSTTPWPDSLATWRSFNLASFHRPISITNVGSFHNLCPAATPTKPCHAFCASFQRKRVRRAVLGGTVLSWACQVWFPLVSQQSWFTKNGPLGNDRVIIPWRVINHRLIA